MESFLTNLTFIHIKWNAVSQLKHFIHKIQALINQGVSRNLVKLIEGMYAGLKA